LGLGCPLEGTLGVFLELNKFEFTGKIPYNQNKKKNE
tara:strand:+ start:433 stop:543 length:111 start_codon:yes stop_codon:yes gene_type:complete